MLVTRLEQGQKHFPAALRTVESRSDTSLEHPLCVGTPAEPGICRHQSALCETEAQGSHSVVAATAVTPLARVSAHCISSLGARRLQVVIEPPPTASLVAAAVCVH